MATKRHAFLLNHSYIYSGNRCGHGPLVFLSECPDIKAGDHSSETFTDDRFYESIATFSCEMGFTIGDQTNPLICQANKEWSGVVPSCEWIGMYRCNEV